jgi:hypothetical protein
MASVLGQPTLQGPQRDAVLPSDMGQRHGVFHTGLQHPIAFEGSCAVVGR